MKTPAKKKPAAIVIDPEFKSLISPLLPDEFKLLEHNIMADGCQEPLTVWGNILIDGHNRYKICQRHHVQFKVEKLAFTSRDHVKLWIIERQLGRRNLTDDQRSVVANEMRGLRSRLAQSKAAKVAADTRWKASDLAETTKPDRPTNNRKAVAKEHKLPEKKIRHAAAIKKADPKIYQMVRDGKINLHEGKKLIALPVTARKSAMQAVASGIDTRTAVRDATKHDYNARISATKPKPLEGTYRIILADVPWSYSSLNYRSDYVAPGAADHYDAMTDEELCLFRPDGKRTVEELADRNAVLFFWVTAPMLEHAFPIIKSWGFTYKEFFVWDKVRHNVGHYNSVRAELLLVCIRGSCLPDTDKLIDLVQEIERISEKPEEFRTIIESMYTYGRKLELFARKARPGWDAVGNQIP